MALGGPYEGLLSLALGGLYEGLLDLALGVCGLYLVIALFTKTAGDWREMGEKTSQLTSCKKSQRHG